jgi:hypothetical protein
MVIIVETVIPASKIKIPMFVMEGVIRYDPRKVQSPVWATASKTYYG